MADDGTPRPPVARLEALAADVTKGYGSKRIPPEWARERARALLVLALDRMEARLETPGQEHTLNELSQAVSALGRVSGLATDTDATGAVTLRVVRDAVPSSVAEVGTGDAATGATPALPAPAPSYSRESPAEVLSVETVAPPEPLP